MSENKNNDVVEDVEINLSEKEITNEPEPNATVQPVEADSPQMVESKPNDELTEEEKQIIINNAKAGVASDIYDVKFFKNGNIRIKNKKIKSPPVSTRAAKQAPPAAEPPKVYYTDQQLLMEHIIELNSKCDKLLAKHKKLKRKYKALSNDVYIDTDDEPQIEEQPPVQQQPQVKFAPQQMPVQRQPKPVTRGWRSNVHYML